MKQVDTMLLPESEAEIAALVREAQAPLRPVGGGTRALGAQTGRPLSTTRVSGIELYEPGALTLVARAGTPLIEVEAALAAENQRLPFEPWRWGAASTIGGVVASNASGPRRIQSGACRDSLIGVRFVDGTGTIIKNGGRVMKNVTGYDLVKLMAGSWGTLGILSEVAFKVLPGVETTQTLVIHGLNDHQAVEAMARALGSPFDVSGAAHVSGETPETYIRLEGFAGAVTYRIGQLRDSFASLGEITVIEGLGPWAELRDGAMAEGEGALWRISVKPSDGPDLVARLGVKGAQYDWGGGLIWVRSNAPVRLHLKGIGGHATLLQSATSQEPAFQPEGPAIAALSSQLRSKFDPRGILNPGLMG